MYSRVAPAATNSAVSSWNLETDMAANPAKNPAPDSHGTSGVWSFMQSSSLAQDGNYRLLPSYSAIFDGIGGFDTWFGTVSSCSALPEIGVNVSGSSQSACTFTVPASTVFVHPANPQMAVVGWKSPITGTVQISGGVTSLDGGSQGITWYVDEGTTTLASGTNSAGASTPFPDTSAAVTIGEFLYFIVGPSLSGAIGNDTTGLSVNIDSASTHDCTPSTNLLGNPGFEFPVASSDSSNPITVNNWLPHGAPVTVTSSPSRPCGTQSGQVTTGYWVQDLPIASDPSPPATLFDPTKPFQFSFWFNPAALGNEVQLVQNWDRGGGCYDNLVSMSLTAPVSGGFQTNSVAGKKTLRRSPIVSANSWHEFVATSNGIGQPVAVSIDGSHLGKAKLSSSKTCRKLPVATGRTTVLMGATGGPNSAGPTNVAYDDVYLGPAVSTRIAVIGPSSPPAIGQEFQYAAAIAPASPSVLQSNGVVTFTDNGSPAQNCVSLPPEDLLGTLIAVCSQKYTSAGTHKIVASFSGGDGTTPSTSSMLLETTTNYSLSQLANPIWSGYAAEAPSGTQYTGIKGDFVLPNISQGELDAACPSTITSGPCFKSAIWLGIGGLHNSNLAQAGIEIDLDSGRVQNLGAWTETVGTKRCGVPLSEKSCPLTVGVQLGDTIEVEVREIASNRWTLSVSDLTQINKGFADYDSVTYSFSSNQRSAEAIVERTNAGNDTKGPALTPSDPIIFDNLVYSTSKPGTGAKWQPFFQTPLNAQLDVLTLDSPLSSYTTATPSAIDGNNDGFEVADGQVVPPTPPS